MAKQVIWSVHAVADRISILDYWNKRTGNNNYSKKLDSVLKNSIRLIGKFPFLGRRFKKTRLRFFIRGDYLIFYKIKDEQISILHIWDNRRNPENLKV